MATAPQVETKSSPASIPAYVLDANHGRTTAETHEASYLKKIRKVMDLTGMPTVGVTSIVYQRTSEEEKQSGWRTLGSMCISGKNKGRLKVTDAVTNPDILFGMGGTIYHEMAHSLNPFDYANSINKNMYKSEEGASRVREFVIQLSNQTQDSQVFLNSYHKKIFKEAEIMREKGEFAEADNHIYLETHAIVMEMLATRPQELLEKSAAQTKRMKELGRDSVSAYKVALNCFKELTGFGDTKDAIEQRLLANRVAINLLLNVPGAYDTAVKHGHYDIAHDSIHTSSFEWVYDENLKMWIKKVKFVN